MELLTGNQPVYRRLGGGVSLAMKKGIVGMSHYKSNLRDIEFNLFEVFGAGDRMGTAAFEDMDVEHRQGLPEADRRAGDGHRCPTRSPAPTATRRSTTRRPTRSRCPRTSRRPTSALMDAEGWRLEIPEETRRHRDCPPSLRWAVAELVLGSNPAAFMYMSGPGFAGILLQPRQRGPEEDGRAHDRRPVGRHHGAHRARRRLRRRRRHAPRPSTTSDGTWRIEGVKRFITSAEHDMSDNIIHLVLARPVGVEGVGGPGHQGPEPVRRAEVPLRPRDRRDSASATAPTSPTSRRRWA